jgi:hypothetical protein
VQNHSRSHCPAKQTDIASNAFELDDSDPQSLARSVMKAIAEGRYQQTGKVILDGLANMMKVIEITELEERIAVWKENIMMNG